MWVLYGKFKNNDWIKIDKIDPLDGSEHPIEERKAYLLNEYKMVFGQGYMFDWRQE